MNEFHASETDLIYRPSLLLVFDCFQKQKQEEKMCRVAGGLLVKALDYRSKDPGFHTAKTTV